MNKILNNYLKTIFTQKHFVIYLNNISNFRVNKVTTWCTRWEKRLRAWTPPTTTYLGSCWTAFTPTTSRTRPRSTCLPWFATPTPATSPRSVTIRMEVSSSGWEISIRKLSSRLCPNLGWKKFHLSSNLFVKLQFLINKV